MTTSARVMNRKTAGETRGNAATAGSLERDTSTGHRKFDGCRDEIRSTIARATWRRSVAEVGLWTTKFVYAHVLKSDVPNEMDYVLV